MKKNLSILVVLAFLSQVGCNTFSMNPPLSSKGYGQAMSANRAEFETFEEEKDPVGQAIFIGLAVAAGVAAAILVPLAINDKIF